MTSPTPTASTLPSSTPTTQCDEVMAGSSWKHTKTGRVYVLIAIARLEPDPTVELVVYRSLADGTVWARPRAVFFERTADGTPRFAPLTAQAGEVSGEP